MGNARELATEQAHVDLAYAELEARRMRAQQLEESAATRSLRTLYERDERAGAASRRRLELELGDLPLCFGRFDMDTTDAADRGDSLGASWYVGRVHVDEPGGDPLVVDWRAPIAEPFYRATQSEPLGVRRRRHLHCRGRQVRGIDDEVFGAATPDEDVALVGEAALLRALDRKRTGRMGDVAATIQADQDRIVRAPLDGTIVVQGGPGTGKTAVALHRLAYLLFTHRAALEKKGVLVVGPNTSFIRYIERVLPSLGEGSAVYRTTAGVRDELLKVVGEPPALRRIKGDERMAEVLQRAVRLRQRPLRKAASVGFGAQRLRFGARASAELIERVQARPGTHNERRPMVVRLVLAALHRDHLRATGRAAAAGLKPSAPLDFDSFAEVARDLVEVRVLFDRLWPELTAEQLLADLYRFPPLWREAAANALSEAEIELVASADATAGEAMPTWTSADVALLDELDVLLGPVHAAPRGREPAEDLDWLADRVLEAVRADPDVPMSASMAAEIRDRVLADQVGRSPTVRPETVSRAFGHIVVDEAQDLSPMEWRMLARRCPSGSFTIVGDQGQASAGWTRTWAEVADGVRAGRPATVVELSVNYRTPFEVMDLASNVLAQAAPHVTPPVSVRSGAPPAFVEASPTDVLAEGVSTALRLRGELEAGTLALIVPGGLVENARRALDADPVGRGRGGDPLDDDVVLLSPTAAKGLEFDGVVVVDPASIADADGLLALYVALTRTTSRLAVVHPGRLPEALCVGTGTSEGGFRGGIPSASGNLGS